MNSEAKLISSICKNKDIQTVLTADVEGLFDTHEDIWLWVRDYYFNHQSTPPLEEIEAKFPEFEGVDVKGETAYYLDELRNDYINTEVKQILFEEGERHGQIPGQQLLERFQRRFNQIAKEANIVRDVDITDYEQAEKHIEKKKQRAKEMGGSPGIRTGLPLLDAFYPTGLAAGHLIVLIGWSGKGKSWFMTYLACKAWAQGYKPMIVSLEMTPEEVRERAYTIMASGLFRNTDFSSGNVDLDEFHKWSKETLADKHKFVVVSNEGRASVTPSTVQAKIDQHRPDIVFLDYQQLFDSDDSSGNEVTKNKNISREFKLMAVRNAIPVVNLTQATYSDPSQTQEPPMIEDVAWAKSIYHDADLGIAVHKHDSETHDLEASSLFTIVGRKNRHGTEFEFDLDWDIDRGIIRESADDF